MFDDYTAERKVLLEELKAQGINDEAVLKAVEEVPRHEFVPIELRTSAYDNSPLSIGYEQTISQPYIVAFMTQTAELSPEDVVLEIGTGSGYQAAILSKVCKEVYSVEVIPELAERASEVLARLGCDNVYSKVGSGYDPHWGDKKFDAILVTAAPKKVPQSLVDQLKVGGRLIIPVGEGSQKLMRLIKTEKGMKEEELLDVRFVRMI